MRHIIKGNPERTERAAMKAALDIHQAKYGDYWANPRKASHTQSKFSEEKFFIEIINR
ncbi:DUF4060 family protein [Hafnia alvei]|uniref:DUF4060 family protein n=1 Tax=Hafnia alvei TaxID=569 RepID=UPI00214B97D1|nr:DUF4060 family protein [Hafnia alvei]